MVIVRTESSIEERELGRQPTKEKQKALKFARKSADVSFLNEFLTRSGGELTRLRMEA
jgi:hypothetical protein